MILLALALMAQTAPPPAVGDDIVVTGERLKRLKRLKMTAARDPKTGTTRCVFKRSSGDPALDATVCDAVLACVPKITTVAEMRTCIAPTMDALVAGGVPWRTKAADAGR